MAGHFIMEVNIPTPDSTKCEDNIQSKYESLVYAHKTLEDELKSYRDLNKTLMDKMNQFESILAKINTQSTNVKETHSIIPSY